MAEQLESCAREILEVIPQIMQEFRQSMRGNRAPDLRVPEMRSLAYVRRNPGANLTDLAEHIGVTLPSMSKLVDGLTYRGLIDRQPDTGDRRRLRLYLTDSGRASFEQTRETVKSVFAKRLSVLDAADIDTVVEALRLLRSVFVQGEDATASGGVAQSAPIAMAAAGR